MLINYPVEQLLLRIISTPLNCLFVKVAIYCRVSSAENKPNLEYQAERLLNYCFFKGSSVVRVVKEVGSGVSYVLKVKSNYDSHRTSKNCSSG